MGTNNQAADALSWLSTTVEVCKPIDDELPVMLVEFSSKEEGKEGIEPTDITDDYVDNRFNFISPGLLVVCPLVACNPKKSTTSPTLTILLAKPAKDTFCRQVAANVRISIHWYSYDLHAILIHTALRDGAVQAKLQPFLLFQLLSLFHYSKLAGNPGSAACATPWNTNSTSRPWPRTVIRQSTTVATGPETAPLSNENAT